MGLAEYFRMPPPRTGPKLSRAQIQLTALYAYSFGYCGLLMSSLGPALLTLGEHTGSDVAQMGYAFTARSVGYVGGSSLGGPLFDRVNGHRLIAVSLTCAALATIAVPFITSLPLLAFTVAFQGIAMGIMDVGGNVMLLWLHPEFCDPYMQLIHFCFGAGSTITPLVLSAFMATHGNSVTVPFVTLALFVVPSLVGTTIWSPPTNPALKDTANANAGAVTDTAAVVAAAAADAATTDGATTELATVSSDNGSDAAAAAAAAAAAVAAAASTTAVAGSTAAAAGSGSGSGSGAAVVDVSNGDALPSLLANAADRGGGLSSFDRLQHIVFERWSYCAGFTRNERLVILQLAVYLGIYVGAEVAMGGLIYSYVVTRGLMSELDGTHLNALFWGVFAVGRLVAIPLSTRVPPEVMLYSNGLGCLTATIIASVAPDSAGAIIGATCLYGYFMASCFPAAFALADQYLEVNGRVGTWFVIGSAIGEMVMPITTASLFDVNSVWLWRIELVAAVVGLAMMLALRAFTAKRVRPGASTTPTAADAQAHADAAGTVDASTDNAALAAGASDSSSGAAIADDDDGALKFQPLRDRHENMAVRAGFVSASTFGGSTYAAPVAIVAHTPAPLALAAIDGTAGLAGSGSEPELYSLGSDASDAEHAALGSPHSLTLVAAANAAAAGAVSPQLP